MERFVIVPDEKLTPLTVMLKARLPAIADELNAENLTHLMGQGCIALLNTVPTFGALELLLWARAARSYRVAWTSAGSVERPSADLDAGLLREVFFHGEPVEQSGGELQTATWTNLEDKRGRRIARMAGAPVLTFERCTAALTLVEYGAEEKTGNAGRAEVASLSAPASLLGRLIEDSLIRAVLGLELL